VAKFETTATVTPSIFIRIVGQMLSSLADYEDKASGLFVAIESTPRSHGSMPSRGQGGAGKPPLYACEDSLDSACFSHAEISRSMKRNGIYLPTLQGIERCVSAVSKARRQRRRDHESNFKVPFRSRSNWGLISGLDGEGRRVRALPGCDRRNDLRPK